MAGKCRLCGADTTVVHQATVLGKYPAVYERCGRCALIQIADPHWLSIEMDMGVIPADTGMVERNIILKRLCTSILRLGGHGQGKFVDYGGGFGLFTRMMRDAGFDFRHYDPHSQNLAARGFEYIPGTPVDGITMMEVLEHVPEPLALWKEIVALKPKIIIASTTPYPTPFDPGWWYLCPATGQHVSFYSPATFEFLARTYGYHYTGIDSFHVLSRQKLSRAALWFHMKSSPVLSYFCRRTPLTAADMETVLKSSEPSQTKG